MSMPHPGRHKEALPKMLKVLEGRREADGGDHPETLNAIDNLSTCYAGLGGLRLQAHCCRGADAVGMLLRLPKHSLT